MKKSAVAAVCASMMCGVSYAQSSVTLYGTIDNGFNFTSNAGGHKGYSMVSGDAAPSMWGLRGVEDLGGGLTTVFQLENGFDINSGNSLYGGRLFGRQAYIGLNSNDFGNFTLGRQYDPMIDMWSGFTTAGSTIGDFAAHIFDNDNADYSYRFNNSIKYVSPTLRGFQAELAYAFSNSTGFTENRAYSAGATYSTGPISAAIAYSRQTNGGTTNTGAVETGAAFVAATQQNIGAGVKWTFQDSSNIALAYSHTTFGNPRGGLYISDVGTQNWTSWKFDNIEINAQYFLTPAFWIAGSYTFTHAKLNTDSGGSSPNWQQVALAIDYDLSKRTSVYVQGAYQHNNAHTETGIDNAIIIGSTAPSSTGNQTVLRIGLTHRF
ncbi:MULTISPECIES: porin [unclassified Burkholderia]|uniref:porin n=1 Tax=unclassified Burkholderia TaxID=2613784 RepID=UPI002AAF4E17|nr:MULTISPECIES: porin [unclassified Burkholderia]